MVTQSMALLSLEVQRKTNSRSSQEREAILPLHDTLPQVVKASVLYYKNNYKKHITKNKLRVTLTIAVALWVNKSTPPPITTTCMIIHKYSSVLPPCPTRAFLPDPDIRVFFLLSSESRRRTQVEYLTNTLRRAGPTVGFPCPRAYGCQEIRPVTWPYLQTLRWYHP